MGSADMNRIKTWLEEQLRLPHAAEAYPRVARETVDENLDLTTALYRIFEPQVRAMQERGLNWRLKQADFPAVHDFSDFDFARQPSIDGRTQKALKELLNLSFLDPEPDGPTNIVFLGPPGIGKTMLAIAYGVKAVTEGYRVLFTTAYDLAKDLYASLADGTDRKLIRRLAKIPLLIIDEVGYTELSGEQAHLFFQLIAKRAGKTATIITSNKSIKEWGATVPDERIMTPLVDRLLDNCHIFNFRKAKSVRGGRRRTYGADNDKTADDNDKTADEDKGGDDHAGDDDKKKRK